MIRTTLFATLFASAGLAFAAPTSYTIDPSHTYAAYEVGHLGLSSQSGAFTKISGKLSVDEAAKSGNVDITIDAASLQTFFADRDKHLKSADFFNVEQFPTLTFNATKFDIKGDEGTVTGDLTIKGVTKEVTLDVEIDGIAEDPFGVTRLGFEAKTKINRKDFGVDFNAPMKTGGVLLSEEIKIEIVGSATKQA